MQGILYIMIGIVVFLLFLFIVFVIRRFSKKGLEKQLTELSQIAINAQNNLLNNNEEKLRSIYNKSADIKKDAIKTTVSAFKSGLTQGETIFCKHCGASIDADSKFCKSCGKEQ